MTPDKAWSDDGFFLSGSNPTATVDQRDMEALALKVMDMPVVRRGIDNAAMRWKTIVGKEGTAETWARFDAQMLEEFAFGSVLKAVNSDPNYPKVLGHLYGPPHEWFGMKVPGCRSGGGDGPDQHYSIVPIDAYARYELHGQRFEPGVVDVPFALVADISVNMTLSMLAWRDVQIDSNGRFVITLDPRPADGRSNHIQTKLESRYLFIRDCRADWRQKPNGYRIKRLDPPTAPPMTIDQIAERAALFMNMDVSVMYWWMRTYGVREVNTFSDPVNAGPMGGCSLQRICFAKLDLPGDRACVVTFGSGGAAFRDIVLKDNFFRTFDYWNHTSNMNNAQGVPNPDGSTTYVISIQDPGVHNWLDPVGFHELLVVHRWQGLPSTPGPEGEPWVKSRWVSLDELDQALPPGTKRVTPRERERQLAERLETFRLRYVDH
ncbi:MAG TPA: hypothetical protein VJQ47_14460 [Steroidobacteraceae bacterium]|nr:hypothetical protein [Steroidobacteraceae bacterium]